MVKKLGRACKLTLPSYMYTLDNVYMYDHECDIFTMSRTEYCVEVEIKTTRSDFFRDFEKPKHILMQKAFEKERYYLRKTKDSTFFQGKMSIYNRCLVDWVDLHESLPNRFYFASYEGLISISDLPDYAGLILVNSEGVGEIKKRAPFLHKKKFSNWRKLLDKFYYRSINEDLKKGI